MSDSLGAFSAARFRDCLNDRFSVPLDDRDPIELELTEVKDLKTDSKREDANPFSLLFRGPSDIILQQQIVSMENPRLGVLGLFLVPVGPDPDDQERRILYEAVFT